MTNTYLGNCLVLENTELATDTYLMRLDAPVIAENGSPGQFVMVRTSPAPESGGGPLLKRPFSIHRLGPGGEIALLYRVVGLGTQCLSSIGAGNRLEVLGPLGRGFTLPATLPRAYLVGGGMGLAPLLALAEALADRTEVNLFYGAKTRDEMLPLSYLAHFRSELRLATEDGTNGYHGLVTDPLALALRLKPAPIFTCGPRPMLAAVAELAASAGVQAQVSLEAHMACGLGACLGCVTPSSDSGYKRVCLDGPVFLSEVIKW